MNAPSSQTVAVGRKPLGLFLNTVPAPSAIYESGKMAYRGLLCSDRYELNYLEIDQTSRLVSREYDFYLFNYHIWDMGWLETKSLRNLPGLKLTLVLEMLPNEPFFWCPADDFDAYCVLDPTMNVADKRVYAVPRPLEAPATIAQYREPEIPLIGSFGFATPGKGFELLVDAVNREFDRAIVRINIPAMSEASEQHAWKFHRRNHADYMRELCERVANPGIQVVITNDYMSKDELIDWCSQNTLNCFLYSRHQQPGLAATTDQAISSGRPLAVSSNETFRHIHRYIRPYPFQSLRESIASSQSKVLQMQKDWHPRNFALKFEDVLGDLGLLATPESTLAGKSDYHPGASSEPFVLPVREDPKPEPERSRLTDLRAKLSLKYRAKKLLRFEPPVIPKPKLGQPRTLKQELEQLRRECYYITEVKEVYCQTEIPEDRKSDHVVLLVSNKAQQCGIHQYGVNIAEALKKSSRYAFAYAECSDESELQVAVVRTSPKVVIYNYHPLTMPWLSAATTRRYGFPQLGIMHKVTQERAGNTDREMFDYHLCPDPTLVENDPFVFKTPRLIPFYLNYQFAPDVVTVGSYGFGAGDKGFERLVSQVQEEFDEARITLHLPLNDSVARESQAEVRATAERCRRLIFKPKIQLVINHEFLSKQQLLDFLASNSLNAFLFDTNKHSGISSSLDFALAVQRPIAITKCDMFRHLYSAKPSVFIEDSSLRQIIDNEIAPLVPFYNEWSEPRFILSYENILDRIIDRRLQNASTACSLPIKLD